MQPRPSRSIILLCIAGLVASSAACDLQRAAAPAGEPGGAAIAVPKLLDDLGGRSRPITTRHAGAQRYFDQGLALTYGFNHEAAVRAFREAARLDPACASCEWGVALALGPNINAPMGPEAGREAHAAAQRALTLARGASAVSAVERALVEALAQRYVAEPPEDRSELDRAYAVAMQAVQASHPEDVDVATLTAEALMDLSPWSYWTADGEPREHTREIVALLEGVLARDPEHLGANHYYIHAVELPAPEKAVAAADRLARLAPDAGHLVHMPSHIYWRVGRYEDALEINRRAIASDERVFAWCRPGAFYRAAYYPHNIHFLWAAASAEGRGELALTAARKLAAETEPLHAEFSFMEEFIATPILTLVRFGRFDAVLGEPMPPTERPYLTGIWHYARGIAFVRLGDPNAAERELAALHEAAARPEAETLGLAGGTASARALLAIGEAHLTGEIDAARGDPDAAVSALEGAVAHQDALAYMEPPPWYFPVRQALGAVLLEADRAAQAEATYRRDLEQYPRNGWSLFGLARSLEAQGRNDEADLVQQGFERAFARADVRLERSRF